MESIEEEEQQQPLKLYFIPYLAAGHLIPLCDIASLFAARGHTVTIITTPSNAQILPKSHHFRIQTFQFPSQQVGLPDGVENLSATTNLDEAYKIYEATLLLSNFNYNVNPQPFHHPNPSTSTPVTISTLNLSKGGLVSDPDGGPQLTPPQLDLNSLITLYSKTSFSGPP